MTGFLIIFFILSITITYYGIIRNKKRRGLVVLPPGPTGIPILGNLHQMAKNAPAKMSEWVAQYGKLYTVYLGSKATLVVNDATLIRQIFGLPESTGQFSSDLMRILLQDSYGMGYKEAQGSTYFIIHCDAIEQRTFLIKTLKDLGLNKTSQMQPTIQEEITDLSDWISAEMDVHGTVHLSKRLKITTGNILWSVAAGERKSTVIAELVDEWAKGWNDTTNTGLLVLPWLKYVAPKMSGYTDYVRTCTKIHEFVQTYFDDPLRHEGQLDDVISTYIKRVKNTTDKESSFYGEVGLQHSFSSVISLLIAGTETTATSINWLIFYLTAHPDVQRKLQEEIDEVIGEDREPAVEDQNRMPYTQAVIEETFRRSSLAPVGVIHAVHEDVSFLNYKLPKGLHLIANIYHVHNDPKVWGDPENFRPERFLEGDNDSTKENKLKIKTELKDNVLIFQAGKRSCPGEPLARDVIFLSVTKLLRRFHFSPETGRDMREYMEPVVGYMLLPKQLGIVAKARKK